jgi:hypothetical protein
MKVKIGIEFEVDTEDEDLAKSAASVAAWEYLSFCKNTGYSTGVEEVTVHVDGHGNIDVKIGEDHD